MFDIKKNDKLYLCKLNSDGFVNLEEQKMTRLFPITNYYY